MLKGANKANLVTCEDNIKLELYLFLKKRDLLDISKKSEEFYLVYISEQKYTMEEIANQTGVTVKTLRRHIRDFNNYLMIKI